MNVFDIIAKFNIPEEVTDCHPYGNGHINSTFLATTASGKKYILQAINTSVFKKPSEVMANIRKVTDFLLDVCEDRRSVMTVIPTRDGELTVNADGKVFRLLDFVDGSICLEAPESEADFYESAFAFGRFQRLLGGFDASQLYETIPDFHNTEKRYANLLAAIEKDTCGRVKDVQEEIEFAKSRSEFYSVLANANKNGVLPLRVTHNDTKINNVLLDAETRKALCVIDLDTIMPGFSVTDFGDAIRFGASTAAEDEKDLTKVTIDLDLFAAYAKGFLDGCGGSLGKEEIMLFPEGAKMMTIECGMRFLTDYLEGDTYFKTAYPEHNLDRCHTQFRLVSEMERKWDEMKKIVESLI